MILQRSAAGLGDLSCTTDGSDSPLPLVEEIFLRYLPRLYGLARRMTGHDSDADDVVQDVFVQVLRKLGSFRGDAELSTWLHRVTVNAALQLRQKQARRRRREAGPPEVAYSKRLAPRRGRVPQAPEQEVLWEEARQVVHQAIAGLPEMYRCVFVLADGKHLSNAEIGTRLGLSLAAVKSRLHYARRLLRRSLAPYLCSA